MNNPIPQNPILTLYLQHPAGGTTNLCLRYQGGRYELLSQYKARPLCNGETIAFNEWSITVQVDMPVPIKICEPEHPTYSELTTAIPVLEQLRKRAPIETDHLTQQDSLDLLNHYFKPQDPEIL